MIFLHSPKMWQIRNGKKFHYLYAAGQKISFANANRRFREHAKTLGLNLTYEEEPGIHEWGYWDQKIQRVLEWFPIKKSK